MTILKPWSFFNPREHCHSEYMKYDMPQMDVYTCYVESELVFWHEIKLIVLDNDSVGEYSYVMVQMAEQYNGQYQNTTLSRFKEICEECEGWDEVWKVVQAKLDELKLPY